MLRVIGCGVAVWILGAGSAMAAEVVYTCEREGGKLEVSNTPFEAGACKKVTESLVDAEINLVTSEQPELTGGDSGAARTAPDLTPSNEQLMSEDFAAATSAVNAAEGANLSARSAESAAELAQQLAAKPYDVSLEKAAEAAANSALETVKPTLDAAAEAAEAAEALRVRNPGAQRPQQQVAVNTGRAAKGADIAGVETEKAAKFTEEAIELSRAGAPQEEIQAAADKASESAEVASGGAEASNNASEGIDPSGGGLARGAPTAISGDTAAGADTATSAVLAAPATFGASGTFAAPAPLPPAVIGGP